MKSKNMDVFFCEHCKKHLFRKSAMTRHEKLCLNNPENHKKCLSGCKYIEVIKHTVIFDRYNQSYPDSYNEKIVNVFRCNKFDKLMFPFSIERKKLHLKHDTFKDQEPMTKECKGFEHEYNLNDSDIFNFNW